MTGISTSNNTSGATDIIVNGADRVGTSSYGILAANSATTTSLTVNAAAVSGGITGIATNNFGTSATWITARGDVDWNHRSWHQRPELRNGDRPDGECA